MKLILRIVLTWALALALVLVVIDLVKSFSASAVVFTSLGDIWQSVNAESFQAAYDGLSTQFAAFGAEALAQGFFTLPGWMLFLALGLVLMVIARPGKADTFVKTR